MILISIYGLVVRVVCADMCWYAWFASLVIPMDIRARGFHDMRELVLVLMVCTSYHTISYAKSTYFVLRVAEVCVVCLFRHRGGVIFMDLLVCGSLGTRLLALVRMVCFASNTISHV